MNYQKCFGTSIRAGPQKYGRARIDWERFNPSFLRQKVVRSPWQKSGKVIRLTNNRYKVPVFPSKLLILN